MVLDPENRKVTATFNVGAGPDVLAYDPALSLLYVAAESGLVSAFKANSGQLEAAGGGLVGPNAYLVAVDPTTHRS